MFWYLTHFSTKVIFNRFVNKVQKLQFIVTWCQNCYAFCYFTLLSTGSVLHRYLFYVVLKVTEMSTTMLKEEKQCCQLRSYFLANCFKKLPYFFTILQSEKPIMFNSSVGNTEKGLQFLSLPEKKLSWIPSVN